MNQANQPDNDSSPDSVRLSRRHLADPKQLGRVAKDLLHAPEPTSVEATAAAIITLRREAMACWFELQFAAHQQDRAVAIDCFDLVVAIEGQLSAYQPHSEISRLNFADSAALTVDPKVADLLTRCADYFEQTDGAVNVTAGKLISLWSIGRHERRLPTNDELHAAIATYQSAESATTEACGRPSFALRVTDGQQVQLLGGAQLNLGTVGKGYALDELARELSARSFGPVLMSAGGSSILAVGKPIWDDAWHVAIKHPIDPSVTLAVARLVDRAMSTSANTYQQIELPRAATTSIDQPSTLRVGHLLDPRTGKPAEGTLQATAFARTAELAEVLSTAFFVNGVAWTDAYCAAHPEVAAIVIPDQTARQRTIEPLLFGQIELAPVG